MLLLISYPEALKWNLRLLGCTVLFLTAEADKAKEMEKEELGSETVTQLVNSSSPHEHKSFLHNQVQFPSDVKHLFCFSSKSNVWFWGLHQTAPHL